jgi:hypothetical protein
MRIQTEICKHSRCRKTAVEIYVDDDHDSTRGDYFVNGYCSLTCFVCDLKHMYDENPQRATAALETIITN